MGADNFFNRLKRRYFFAFSLLAIFSIFAYVNLYWLISSQFVFSEIINKSGKQRMLSQRIALLANQFEDEDGLQQWRDVYGDKFIDAVVLFAEDHGFLMRQEMNHAIKTIYDDWKLDARVQEYIGEAGIFYATPSKENSARLFTRSQSILPDLDETVYQYQILDEKKTARLKLIESLILVSALLTLLLEAIFIFYPSLNEVKRSIMKDKIILENSKYAFLNEFFRSIAYQWRQPLTMISLAFDNILDLYRYGDLTREKLDAACKTGKEQIGYLNETINTATKNNQSDRHQLFSVQKAIARANDIMCANYNCAEIHVEIRGDDYTLSGDIDSFTQIILSILTNSADAIHTRQAAEPDFVGEVDIHVQVHNTTLTIDITDNGSDMTSRTLKGIFEPDDTAKSGSSDRGISLYVSKKILEERFGGFIEAKRQGHSTSMHLSIPLIAYRLDSF